MRESRKLVYLRICGSLLAAVLLVAGIARGAQVVPAGTAHSVTLTWQAPSPVGGSGTISGYNVYRSIPSAANYTKVNAALSAALTFTDTNVSAGSSYSYCVTTVDSLGEESACSAPASANVPSNPNAPSAPLITVK
jgi:fibronectin type 3 domain-containing protein